MCIVYMGMFTLLYTYSICTEYITYNFASLCCVVSLCMYIYVGEKQVINKKKRYLRCVYYYTRRERGEIN